MAVSLSFLLILPLITGSKSVKTITKVSVQEGASVRIPCSYDLIYINHVKYLCKGRYWNSCSYEIKTDSPRETGKYSISDDKIQRIFTVTIKQLTAADTYYWCIVEINRGGDDGQRFQLSVAKGTPTLWVADQNLTRFIGDEININFNSHTSGQIKWCKLGNTCVTEPTGKIDGTTVTIKKGAGNVISVTMSGLKQEDSGWYYCVKGEFQMPVHLTVTVKPTVAPTTTSATTIIAATSTITAATNTTTAPNRLGPLMSLSIPLSVLIFIVIAALSILFSLRRTKRVRVKDSTASKNEGNLTYSEVSFKKNKAAQAASDADVTYSSVVPVKKQSVRRSEGKDEDVTYSTIIHQKRNV